MVLFNHQTHTATHRPFIKRWQSLGLFVQKTSLVFQARPQAPTACCKCVNSWGATGGQEVGWSLPVLPCLLVISVILFADLYNCALVFVSACVCAFCQTLAESVFQFEYCRFFYFVMPGVNVLVACINKSLDVFCFSLFHNIGLTEVTWLSKVRME